MISRERIDLWKRCLVLKASGAIATDRQVRKRRRILSREVETRGKSEGGEGVNICAHDTSEENEGMSVSPVTNAVGKGGSRVLFLRVMRVKT